MALAWRVRLMRAIPVEGMNEAVLEKEGPSETRLQHPEMFLLELMSAVTC